MLQVKDADEAMRVAKEMVRRHLQLVNQVGPASSAKDVALRILVTELTSGLQSNRSSSESAADAMDSSPISASPPSRQRPLPESLQHSEIPAETPLPRGKVESGTPSSLPMVTRSSLQRCAYCNEPTSHYCKESGRRHETTNERHMRLWRRMYRCLAAAASFVNTARLARKNTCTEDFSIELDL